MTIQERHANPEWEDSDRVFIVRFWIERESTPDAVPFWRAKVSDVMSGEERHVNSVDAALELVRVSMSTRAI